MKKLILTLFAATAVFAVSAQEDVTAIYNAAVDAFNQKQFDVAAENFTKVITLGMDDEEFASLIANSKANIPTCYFQLGGRQIRTKNYDAALELFSTSADYAELWDNVAALNKANVWIANTYKMQGGDAFNAKDYSTAKEIFAKGYEFDSRNTEMATWLAISYCETDEFEKGMEILYEIVTLGSRNPKYEAAATEADKNIKLYTINRVAAFQAEGNNDGVIAMAEWILSHDATNALAEKIRIQAYYDKKDYAAVAEAAEAAAAAQVDDAEKSAVYFILGASYNDREMRDQAIAAFKKVTAGPNAEVAAATIAELSK